MSIQDKIIEKELITKWESFKNLKDNFDNAKSMLKESIIKLKSSDIYDATADIDEKTIVTEYELKSTEKD